MSIPPAGSQPKPVRALGPAIVIILILLAAGLGYYQIIYYPPHHTSTVSTAAATDPHSGNVTILPGAAAGPRDRTFVPNTITVVVGYNATVNWFNNDTGVLHTVTANATDASIDPSFSAWATTGNDIQFGATLTFTFTKPGTYGYFCEIHPLTMAGTVIVLPGSNSTSGSGASSATTSTG
jgi:plastocyanin